MKLKNIILLTLFVVLTGSAFSKHVDENTARKVAATFSSTMTQTKGAQTLNLVYTAQNETTTQTYFYVFNTTDGFIIIAGDDNITPVLAYSTESQFVTENMPIHISTFFKDYERTIQHVIDNNIICAPETTQEWKDLINGNITATKGTNAVEALLSDTWGQGNTTKPTYNAKCPQHNGSYAVTGCMATVLSQIMRYHKYPSTGFGSHSYTPERFGSRYGKQSCDFAATTFNFNNMPNKLSSTSSAAQIDAVSTLMYACGVAVEMDYGTANEGGSGAYLEESEFKVHGGQYALKQYFDYPLTSVITRSEIKDAQFLAQIKANLDKRLPVAITGCNAKQESGHVFICDGYDASDKLHINWGWDGSLNGYFALGGLAPKSGSIAYDFNYYNQAMINIIPANKISDFADNCLVLNSATKINPTTIPCGNTFTIKTNIINKGSKAFNGELRAFLTYGYMDILKQIGSVSANIAAKASKEITFNCEGVSGINPGKQAIMIEYKPSGSTTWIRVAGLGDNTMPFYATFDGKTSISANVSNITDKSASFHATVEPGCAIVSNRGFEYKKAIESNYTTTYESSNTMTKTITGLFPNTTYNMRVWCLINGQRYYGNVITFNTKSTGIEDITFGDVTVYPNPAKDNLYIDMSNSAQTIDKVELINSLGQTMYHITSPASSLYTIPTSKFANGLYFIRFTSNEGILTKKVLISK